MQYVKKHGNKAYSKNKRLISININRLQLTNLMKCLLNCKKRHDFGLRTMNHG